MPIKGARGETHIITLRVRCADNRVIEVESQSQSGGYEWRGEDTHTCEHRQKFPARACRHIQAVRQWAAQVAAARERAII